MVICSKCNANGHRAHQCRGPDAPPDRSNPKDWNRFCMRCKTVGHKEANCIINNMADLNAYTAVGQEARGPSSGRGPVYSNADGRLCFLCGDYGHIGQTCPIGYVFGINKDACYICGSMDHFKKSCPKRTAENISAPWRNMARGFSGHYDKQRHHRCCHCQGKGHKGAACPNTVYEGEPPCDPCELCKGNGHTFNTHVKWAREYGLPLSSLVTSEFRQEMEKLREEEMRKSQNRP